MSFQWVWRSAETRGAVEQIFDLPAKIGAMQTGLIKPVLELAGAACHVTADL